MFIQIEHEIVGNDRISGRKERNQAIDKVPFGARIRNHATSASARLIGTGSPDYSNRKAMTVAEVERWLGPNLNYDPAE